MLEPHLSPNALKVLQQRYLKRENGQVVESPSDLFQRVAYHVALADQNYGASQAEIEATTRSFYDMMASLEFVPNSPTLMNAGRELGQLSACFVLPVPDTMEGIFSAVGNAAMVHKSGGGTGFDFSDLRPKNASVRSTGGVASGPVSFMRVFNSATEAVKQGGVRRGANMGILRVDHPDIREFITCKRDNADITNFNISVAITEEFMQALAADGEYDLRHGSRVYRKERAREVWEMIIEGAWRNGEPGIVFIDRMNKDNPVPHVGRIQSTNPCGEQPLLANESCNLGSVNLSLMVKTEGGKTTIDYDNLEEVVRKSIHFLDNVIEVNQYPLEAIREATLANRKVGLGVMGFADLLFKLDIPYDSSRAVELADQLMGFIQKTAKDESSRLAILRGNFPNWTGSIFDRDGVPMRNATVTTIAPTGSISMIAGCSSGIEPIFALAFVKTVMDGTQLVEVNPLFEERAKSTGFYSPALMAELAKTGRANGLDGVPAEVQRVFVTAQEISPEAHIAIQAAFQRHIDNAVSKTINFGHEATREDVDRAYWLAYESGCKGLTVYRDGSRDEQVYTVGTDAKKQTAPQVPQPATPEAREFSPRPRPDITKGEIEKVSIGCGSLYVISARDEVGLAEVFCETGKLGGCESQSEATGRLISYCLRLGRTPEEVEMIARDIVDQLRGIRCPACIRRPGIKVTSCPDAIARSLQKQFPGLNKTAKPNPPEPGPQAALASAASEIAATSSAAPTTGGGTPCPECGKSLVPQSGCFTCPHCGFSKCG